MKRLCLILAFILAFTAPVPASASAAGDALKLGVRHALIGHGVEGVVGGTAAHLLKELDAREQRFFEIVKTIDAEQAMF